MTIFISIIGVVVRFASALLTTALGWASSLLFGRVQRSHQIFVILMLAGSLTWMCFIVGALWPGVPGYLFDATPHPGFIDRSWLRLVILGGLVLLPLGVGLAAYLVPTGDDRPSGLRIPLELLRGYILTPVLGALMLFLPAVGISRKARSVRHRWSDVHVPIVVKPKGYDQTVADLQHALASVGLEVEAEEAPAVLSLPAWVLTRIAGNNIRKLRPDRLIELKGPCLRVGVYPSDVAISGPQPERGMARVAVLSRLATTAAWLTTSAEAQSVEDLLTHVHERLSESGSVTPAMVAAEFSEIDDTLLRLEVPDEEWDILYRIRLQIERDVLVELVDEGALATVTPKFARARIGRAARRPTLESGALPATH
ncbi:MAG TPA: hypothetical protein VGQ31_04565 [Candidatus Limnocylindrales bacterium]|nr:hypothetical protein [Candidatus Limnocylindrales bacterium]